jgi:hypothetical protein
MGVAAALVLLVGLTGGINALWSHHGSYQVISYPVLLVTVLLPCAWSTAVMMRAIARYWRDAHGPHSVYRFLAIAADNIESRHAG